VRVRFPCATRRNVFTKSQRGAERILESIKKFIEKKLKLKINEEKSKARKSNEVKFLGMTIIEGTIAIAKASYDKAMEKVKSLLPRGSHLPTEKAMEEVNTWYRGWASYFKMTQYPAQLKAIEAHIRRRFRARIVVRQKKKRNLLRLLMKMGIKRKTANNTVYSNRGIWNLSHTSALDKAFSIKWFVERAGQIIMSSPPMKHWFGMEKWVKLA
jgi:RNA-directed DNA polymerase